MKRTAAIILALLIPALAACACITGGCSGNGARGNARQAQIRHDPNDPDRCYIFVSAQKGSTVVFVGTDGSKEEKIAAYNKEVAFNVGVDALIPQTYIATDRLTVHPTLYSINSRGDRTEIESDGIELSVPPIEIDFFTADFIESEDGYVQIRGCVAESQRKAELTVGGEPVKVDRNGNFAYSTMLNKGEHSLEFAAKLEAHTTLHKRFLASVANALAPEYVITIPESFGVRSLNIDSSIKVYGAVPTGARLTVSSDDPAFSLKTEPEVDGNGNFSFEVNLPIEEKSYEFIITATLESGAVYARPFSVERPPAYIDYVPRTKSGDYSALINADNALNRTPLRIRGAVTEIFYDGDYLLAEFKLESGELIEIEYHDHYPTAISLEEGATHTLFGYSLGTDESQSGCPRLFVWFAQD